MSSIRSAAPPALLQGQPDARSLKPPSQKRTVQVALLATLLGLLSFLLIQALLAAYNLEVIRGAIDQGEYETSSWDRLTILSRLFPWTAVGMIDFVTLAIAGTVIASRGHRVLFAVPAVAYLFASVFVSPHHPFPIGFQWTLECFSWDVTYTTCAVPWFGHPWLGPTVDLAFVLVPGWMVARRVRPRRWPGPVDRAVIAAILTCSATVVTAAWAMVVVQRFNDFRVLAAVAALGIALGVARPWWPWLHVLFAASTAGFISLLLDFVLWPHPFYDFADALPYALGRLWPVATVGLIASAWQPLARGIARLQERPIHLVIAVNALNLTDAVMTLLAVKSGGAYESNPFVRFAGLPVKVVLVGALTFLLYRRKPSALAWPFAALLWVTGYHVAGIFVNAWH